MRLPFELDPAIIHHIIYSQAGSIGKAIIELIMNSVDAQANSVSLSMTKDGFQCRDDGTGFAMREDVLRYFGRFGTPHEEGDATYGRFRLGRGQIMAHASTEWQSRTWQMTVDTREMGYSYELEDLPADQAVEGCAIVGRWYEPLTDTELLSALQEIRDLVRYTPVAVELNGRLITRDPQAEKWDFEDEFAWYRVKVEGAVSIYNQGVLVRHDAAQQWGAGGLIVSKRAIALNVSRTEILRKTCPVWKPIAKQFGAMAKAVADRLGEHRKTEARREKAANDLLAGGDYFLKNFIEEETVTILPGKQHVSLGRFLALVLDAGGHVSVVENIFDVPKGEILARHKFAIIVHPCTLERFGCHNTEDFRSLIDQVLPIASARWFALSNQERWDFLTYIPWSGIKVPDFLDFPTLRAALVERTCIVSEKDALDRETRRLWTALRGCLLRYAGTCSDVARSSRSQSNVRRKSHHILLGESNIADAWTDGESYIAYNVHIVKKLRAEPMQTAARLFSLTEHEIAHQGDSIDCGHDEAFYQRYHDISIKNARERQRYMHAFLQKVVYSMEGEGSRARNRAWHEQRLIERANSAREKRALGPVIEDQTVMPYFSEPVMAEDTELISGINACLANAGAQPAEPDWDAVRREAREQQARLSDSWQQEREQRQEQAKLEEQERQQLEEEDEAYWKEFKAYEEQERVRIAALGGIEPQDLHPMVLSEFMGCPDAEILNRWENMMQEIQTYEADRQAETLEFLSATAHKGAQATEARDDPKQHLKEEFHALLQPGETWWSLERNAAAVGFYRVQDYLQWRAASA